MTLSTNIPKAVALAAALTLAACGGTTSSGDTGGGAADAGPRPDTLRPDTAPPKPDAAPAATWNNFAKAFFAKYCVSCHGPSKRARADFRFLSVVKLRLNAIRCGVSPTLLSNCQGQHPPGWFPIGNGPKPTRAERIKLVKWIESGAKE